jgi:putative pyruvate formate lyase activating enzyme
LVKYDIYDREEQVLLSRCTLCPRECGVNRFEGGAGYCDGICNIFFAGCNLRCIYCQNHDISRPGEEFTGGVETLEETLDLIGSMLSDKIRAVGFVSPSHVVPQVRAIIRGLNARGLKPITVYNTNSYDKPEIIDSLDGMIDIYLPDYKYVTPEIAKEYSDASDYPVVALKALKRIYFQKGSSLPMDQEGRAENGMLIRHLVLPGHSDESKKVLRSISEELSPGVHLSLMSQYHPTKYVKSHSMLNRTLYREEYESAVRVMEDLGFRNGWIQDMESYRNYRPDFSRNNPFE